MTPLATHPTPSSPKRTNLARGLLLELALLALVCALLWHLAQVLAVPDLAPGLGQRYLGQPSPGSPGEPDLAVRRGNSQALWLMLHAGQVLTGAALLGWLGLLVARRARRGAGPLILALAMLGGLGLDAFGQRGLWWAAALACALLAGLRNGFGHDGAGQGAGGPAHIWAAAIWPLWVLCGGLGWLWQADFAARGPLEGEVRHLGLYQIQALWLASTVLALACMAAWPLLQAMAQVAAVLRRLSTRPVGVMAWVVGAALLAALGAWMGRSKWAGGLGLPHVTGEWSRWPLLLAMAWFGYRRLDWVMPQSAGAARRRALRHAMPTIAACLLAGAMAGAVWVGSQDFGPAMVMNLAVALVLLATRVVPARQPRLARWVAAALVGLLALGWWWLSTAYLPAHHDRARARDTLRSQTFEAPSDQGAHARWLLAAATPQGFGLARVPWCGARAQVGIEPCPPKGHGPNRTFASDLPVVGLFVTWGHRAGVAVLAALAGLCLCALFACHASARQGVAPSVLRAWVVSLLATTALVQAAVVSAMNLGVLALSGLGLALLGNGGHAMLAMALWLGLACAPLRPAGVTAQARPA